MCRLYGLYYLLLDNKHCFETGYFSGTNSLQLVQEAIKLLFKAIRPQAINLIESSRIPEENTISAIGNYYGDIYETHLDWAMNSRLNKTPDGDSIPEGYLTYITPILKAKM